MGPTTSKKIATISSNPQETFIMNQEINKVVRSSPLFWVNCLITCVGISTLLMSPASAQVNGSGPSSASDFDIVLNLPGDELVITGSVLESIGGITGQTTQLNVNEGGAIGRSFDANAGAEVNVYGGTVDSSFDVNAGAEVNITGGAIGPSLRISSGGEATISGGTVGRDFSARAGSDVELIGGEFRLNGAGFSGGTISLADNDVFTGTLADGSPFIFLDGDSSLPPSTTDFLSGVTLTVVPLPPLDLSPIVINTPVEEPSGLRPGQTLTIVEGGALLKDNFAVVDATLNVEAGTMGEETEISRSVVNISGGTVGDFFQVHAGSVVNISGGTIRPGFWAYSGSVVNISGGSLGRNFRAFTGSDVELIAGEFRLHGAGFSGGTISLADNDVFTGTLADGSPFIFAENNNFLQEVITLTVVPLPPSDLSPIVINTPVEEPSGLRPGQALTIVEGGALLKENFTVVDATLNVEAGTMGELTEVFHSVVNISGGTVGGFFQVHAGSEVNISGGTVSDLFLANDGSEINISGGTVGDRLLVGDLAAGIFGTITEGSLVNISGGTVGDDLVTFAGGEVNISGGTIGERFDAFEGSVVNIIGGTVGDNFDAFEGSVVNISGGTVGDNFDALEGSVVNIYGSEFFIDGVELDTLLLGEAFTITDRDVTLSGLLADGEQFSFDLNSIDTFPNDHFAPDMTLTVTLGSAVPVLGDVNRDGATNFLDISPFIAVLSSGGFQVEADIDQSGSVNFLDISPFIGILSGQ